MVQFTWRSFLRPFQLDTTSKLQAKTLYFDAEEEPWLEEVAGDADPRELCSQVLARVVAKVEGRKGDPTLPVVALTRRLPEEEAANQLFQLATLDLNPYKRELQAALRQAGAVPALVAALSGDGSPQAKQKAALALCSMSRNSQTNRHAARQAVEDALASCIRSSSADVSCVALVLDVLLEGGICQPSSVLDVLSSLSESDPTDLCLQRRTASLLQSLVDAGTIERTSLRKREAALLSAKWSGLLSRFQDAEIEGERLQSRFHADLQAMYHEEVVRHFEYEAAERSLQLQQDEASGSTRLHEVIKCYVENLEDYQTRLEARDLIWSEDEQRLVPLDSGLRRQLCDEVGRRMEPGLIIALQAAAAGPQISLKRRRARLRSECAALLDLKTEATQEHQERAAGLRREAVLFEAIEHLEANSSEASATQVRIALAMFQQLEAAAPIDAVERLRVRLERLQGSHNAASSTS